MREMGPERCTSGVRKERGEAQNKRRPDCRCSSKRDPLVVMGVKRLHLRDGPPGSANATYIIVHDAVGRNYELHDRRRYHHHDSPLAAEPRGLTTPYTHTMALRLAAGRPLGTAVRASNGTRHAVRTFASTALRAKEVAGPSSDTPNLRVRNTI